ncbi:MAG TPA: hypothetical protein VEB40_14645, partial [Flavipsychrobacter sp.]|nr:hypothetical protein [Flavipsychrobacter sp.]
AAVFYVLVVSNRYYEVTRSTNKYGLHLSPLDNPTTAADFIRTWDIKGPAFSDYFVSSYLLYDLYPDFKSYIDLRDLDIFPSKFFNSYFDLYNKPEKFYQLDSVYKFNYVVLATSQLTSLQQLLYWGEGFNVVHIDPVAVIMLRVGPQNEHLNRGPAAQKLFTWPEETTDPGWADALTKMLNPTVSYEKEDERYTPLQAAKYYNMVHNSSVALRFMRPAVQTDFADDPDALATIGLVYKDYADMVEPDEQKRKMLDSAHMYLHKSLDLSDKVPNAHLGLAILAVNQGDFPTAEKHLKKYIDLERNNDYVYYLAGICARNLWQSGAGDKPEDVIGYMKKSVRLNERNDKAYLYMAEAYWAMDDRDKARECMRKTLKLGIPWAAYEKDLHEKMKNLTGIRQAPVPAEMIEHSHDGHNH